MDPFNPTDLDPNGEPLPPAEEETDNANRAGDALADVVGGAADGLDLVGSVVEGVSSAAAGVADAVGSVASGAAELAGGAVEAVGGVAEGLGSAVEGVGAVAEGCGSCSLALLLTLASVGAAVAAVLR
ncbi:hypothetical protein J0H58_14910 [bacterium]|nr:hypothetical protein [bacterium]